MSCWRNKNFFKSVNEQLFVHIIVWGLPIKDLFNLVSSVWSIRPEFFKDNHWFETLSKSETTNHSFYMAPRCFLLWTNMFGFFIHNKFSCSAFKLILYSSALNTWFAFCNKSSLSSLLYCSSKNLSMTIWLFILERPLPRLPGFH